MASDPHYVIWRITAPSGVWTPIIPPADCNHFSLKSSVGQVLRIRSDQADASTEDTLPVGSQEGIVAPQETTVGAMRFQANIQTICYVQPQPAAPDVVVAKFVR